MWLSRAKGASQDTPASKTGKYQRQRYLKGSLYNRVQLDTKLQEAPQSGGRESAFLLTEPDVSVSAPTYFLNKHFHTHTEKESTRVLVTQP